MVMTSLRSTSALLAVLLLAACAEVPKRDAAVPAEPTPPAQASKRIEPPEFPPESLPKVELTRPLLYEYMLSEFANQRGQKALAAQAALDMARNTRDPRLARRAAQLAYESRQVELSLSALKLWLELEPDSALAHRLLALLLIGGGQLDEAQPHLAAMLASDPDNVGAAFMQLAPMLASYPDKAAAYGLVRTLAQPYPDLAEAHWQLAVAARYAGDDATALSEVRRSRELRPDWENPVLLESQLLQAHKPKESTALLTGYLKGHPKARNVRLYYARDLLDQKALPEARAEFEQVLADEPDNVDLAMAVALISLQLNELDRAENQLKDALARSNKGQDALHFYLGQLNEARQHDAEALDDYLAVKSGENLYSAQLRAVYLLNKAKRLTEALTLLHGMSPRNNDQRVQLILLEEQLLRDNGQDEAAYKVMMQGLDRLPNHPDLLYEAALMADRLDKQDVFERLLRKLIQVKPDSAQAYNALGYNFLAHNVRIDEGMKLVLKALELSPDDAAILDSVGWGYYRQGDLGKSLDYLRRAHAANPDPEIAAHLGEVLWQSGDRPAARKVWQDSLDANPGNAVLLSVMKRYAN